MIIFDEIKMGIMIALVVALVGGGLYVRRLYNEVEADKLAISTLQANQVKLLQTNKDNMDTINALRVEHDSSVAIIDELAKQSTELRTNQASLQAAIKKDKGSATRDAPIAPVLMDTLKGLQ